MAICVRFLPGVTLRRSTFIVVFLASFLGFFFLFPRSVCKMSNNISDAELRAQLKKYGVTAGPISNTTRSVYSKKLEKLKRESMPPVLPSSVKTRFRNEDEPPKYGPFKRANSDSTDDWHRSRQHDSSTKTRLNEDEPRYGSLKRENLNSTTDWHSSRLYDFSTKPRFQNEDESAKYGSFRRENLNSSTADWYRSRLHDVGNWANASWSTIGHGNRRRWWHLNANASRWLLYILGVFLALLVALYGIIMNKTRVHFFCIVLLDAMVDTGYFIYNHMILPALIVLLVAAVIFGAIWYKRHKWHKAAEEQQQIFDMVEKILALLKKHYEECLTDNNRQPYLAVPHVRDMLVPRGKRKQLLPIWEKAVQYLNENESRVRTENQIISGEEFMVWRWLQVSGAPAADEKLWQGHAFPEEQAVLNMPLAPYSECLKLRGLFDPDLEEEDDWPEHIQDAILEKLGSSIRVMHVAIDTESKEGCVYMKLGSKEEAGAAYQILHGSWFNGRLVTVKYLRVERYHERFPEAQRCAFPLRVKKPRYSLLG